MNVSLGDSNIKEMRQWFDRAVAAQIDHAGAWRILRWGLRPRWNGDIGSMLAFGVVAADTRRYDSYAPHNLLCSIDDLEAELELPLGHHIYGRGGYLAHHMQQMYEGYIAEPSQSQIRDGWRTSYSIVAFFAREIRYSAGTIGSDELATVALQYVGLGRGPDDHAAGSGTRTSPVSKQIDTAESRRDHGDLAGALQLYRELSAATNTDERTKAFIRDRLVTVNMEQRLKTGEWVDFLPSGGDLTGWTVEQASVRRCLTGRWRCNLTMRVIFFSRGRGSEPISK